MHTTKMAQKHLLKWHLCVFTIRFKGINAFTEQLQVHTQILKWVRTGIWFTFMLYCIYTDNFELAQTALKEKSTSRIQISW